MGALQIPVQGFIHQGGCLLRLPQLDGMDQLLLRRKRIGIAALRRTAGLSPDIPVHNNLLLAQHHLVFHGVQGLLVGLGDAA
ncbi:hypothetical protein D3C72_2433920 [compost metagenome]